MNYDQDDSGFDETEFDDSGFDENDDEDNHGSGLAMGIAIGMVIASVVWGIGKSGKYEGMTAEDWFNAYDNCEARIEVYQSCIEDEIPNAGYYCSP